MSNGNSTMTRPTVPAYAVAGLVSLQALIMYLFAAEGAFFADDLLNIGMLRVDFHTRLTFHYLLTPIFGHFTPGLRFMYWVVTFAHMDYAAGLTLNVALYVVVLLLMYRLLRLLFGDTWMNLLLLFFFGFSALWAPETMWWTAGAHFFPTMSFGLLMIDSFFRFVFTHRRRWLLVSIVAFSFALLWHEKAMILIVMLPVVAGVVLARGSSPLAAIRASLRLTWIWALYLVPAAIYLYHYFVQLTYQPQPRPTVGGMVGLLGVAWVQSFIPAVFGGPLSWRFTASGQGLAAPPAWIMIAGQLIFAGLVAASVRLRGPGVWSAWVLSALAVALYAGLAGYVRLFRYGPSMGTDYRYVFDACVFMTLAVGLAFLPLANNAEKASTAGRPRRRPQHPSARAVAAGGACVLFLGFLVSMSDASRHLADGDPARYSRNLARTISTARPGPDGHRVFYNTIAPEGVITGLFYPYNKVSYFLPVLAPGAESGSGSVPRYMVSADGTVHRARFEPSATATSYAWTFGGGERRKGTADSCAAPTLVPIQGTFPLDHPLGAAQWFMMLTYTGAHKAGVHLAIHTGSGDAIDATGKFDTQRLPDGDGKYLIDFRVDPVTSVGLDLAPNSTLCVTALEVGRPVPVP